MLNLHIKELAEIIDSLPELNSLNFQYENFSSEDELFLCALGFEDRCLAIPENLAKFNYRSKNAIYFKYLTNIDDNKKSEPIIKKHLNNISKNVLCFDVDYINLSHLIREFLDRQVQKNNEGYLPAISIDISVFSSRLLLSILTLAFEYDIKLKILYTEAAMYYPTQEEYEKNITHWMSDETLTLEKGISEIAPSPEHPGLHIDSLPNYVFHFPNFKKSRGIHILHEIDQSLTDLNNNNITWFIGYPPAIHNAWRHTAITEINQIPQKATTVKVSTLDYKETLKSLEIEYNKRWEHHNISITNLGSKMQTIANCLFGILHKDVRIMNATPQTYNAKEYSRGYSNFWKIDFGKTAYVVDLLKTIGQATLISTL